MEVLKINSLLDVDILVNEFLKVHKQGIATMHKIFFHTSNQLSLDALIAELTDELRTGCVTFINKNLNTMDDLYPYLFYIANAFCKKRAQPLIKKLTEYLCPGCLFLGNVNIIECDRILECSECFDKLNSKLDDKHIKLFSTFAKHNKQGYKCSECNRFIPQPFNNISTISCPYFDCFFVGEFSSLKKMHHPTSQSNPEKLILDSSFDGKSSLKDKIKSSDLDVISKIEIKEEIYHQIKAIKDIIESQKNNVIYSSSDFTSKHKILCYQAFSVLLEKYPIEMVGYLSKNTRSGGFQNKVFQEYIKLLENSLPFSFKKNNKVMIVDSLLNENLSLFDGISVFEEIVNEKLIVKNSTSEFYIGGRSASYTKPYYIGKLLNIIDKKTRISLIDKVEEYTFSKIKMKNVVPGTNVAVTHLRVPPHYQLGGMVYVNRVRKKIVDRINAIFTKDDNE